MESTNKQKRNVENATGITRYVPPPPITLTRLPDGAWQVVGPLPEGQFLLVGVDNFSSWMEVDIVRSTTSTTIIKWLA